MKMDIRGLSVFASTNLRKWIGEDFGRWNFSSYEEIYKDV